MFVEKCFLIKVIFPVINIQSEDKNKLHKYILIIKLFPLENNCQLLRPFGMDY